VFTAVQGIGTTTQRVPTPSATTLGELHLGTMREAVGAGFSKSWAAATISASAARARTRPATGSGAAAARAEFAAEPIDSNTRQMEAVLGYTARQFQIQGGYYGSWYTNHNSLVDTATSTPRRDLHPVLPQPALDNQAHQLFVNGGYNLSERTRPRSRSPKRTPRRTSRSRRRGAWRPSAGAPTLLDGPARNPRLLAGGITIARHPDFSCSRGLPLLRFAREDASGAHRAGRPQVRYCVDNTPLRFETPPASSKAPTDGARA
jgi:hypothetical protein